MIFKLIAKIKIRGRQPAAPDFSFLPPDFYHPKYRNSSLPLRYK